jgi:two-component system, OmpR family, sensor histidine kinase CpxA
MKPPRLFLKIFLWFWTTLVLSALSVAVTFLFSHPVTRAQWHRHWIAGLIASALVCYLLARYLTLPVVRLRRAARELAEGNLHSRALGTNRRDELGDLVRDFNVMASRIEELVSRQRQLIYDISHELRSPLARLNVALDLARERKGADPSFDQMEHDLERLNDMITRLLTIAQLDGAAKPLAMSVVDLSELIAQVVHDAGFEARHRDVTVTLSADPECSVVGNTELLSSAIENVVRNAIHYTDVGTTVEVALKSEQVTRRVTLSVRDCGPGVPDTELSRIFLPFYRTAEARDRKSGGAGLGLAIVDRVISSHGGSTGATNRLPQGLEVRISLPSAPPDS